MHTNVEQAGEALADYIDRYRKLWVISGAGVSTDSGIPDYRGVDGQWKRPRRFSMLISWLR
ncbi:Sir2 family NAD-dependent protein deacetylase [Vreelandella azerica]|uniref:Sir2 family NAD-dependent protein deacetylase n=1 Tax=Vreelandella azerica TaxID=2732867 RepID=UPI002E2E88D7|nr:Sir2 family NAD-dependent protein deacetylase [Halomonas azerica]